VFLHVTLAFLAIFRSFSHVPGPPGKNILVLIFESSVERGRSRFFSLQNETFINLSHLSLENIAFSFSDIVLTVIHQWVDYHVISIVFGALPLTFWLATKSFEQFVSNNCASVENGKIGNVIVKYTELKTLIRSINAIWSLLVLNVVIEISLTIIWLHQYVLSGHTVRFIHFGIKLVFLIIGVVIMAEGCRLVSWRRSLAIIIIIFRILIALVMMFVGRIPSSELG